MHRPLIVALDLETDQEALQMAKHLAPWVNLFKVGPVLFLKYGGPFLTQLKALGVDIFLDLKFHDIPSVVAKAVERAGEWGVFSATVHTSGGAEMLRQAVAVTKRPKLWGVTVLTSLDAKDLQQIGVQRPLVGQVEHLAGLASSCGLDGVVASGHEVQSIRKAYPKLEIVTPGIRFSVGGDDDQKRVHTPAEVTHAGATYFVMGRPVLEAQDPIAMVKSIYESLSATKTLADSPKK